jgi:steroid 5-alpha reductase family enzyme
MKRQEQQAVGGIAAALAVGAAVAWAGSQQSVTVGGLPLFAAACAFAFLVQWAVFVPSYLAQTEHYFDLTGSLTYLSLALGIPIVVGTADGRTLLLSALVAIWAMRLGSFLFLRVKAQGSDGRFDELKPSFWRFLMTWTLQGLWVSLTLAAALAAMTSTERPPFGVLGWLGFALWLVGFLFEAVADDQKRRFRANPANEGRFITSGLWAWSRHPNYFGEITLWFGIALIALPALSGWQHATLISPVFVYLLLTRISGIPLLEARAKKRWGDEPAFREYKARTPVLFPRPPKNA